MGNYMGKILIQKKSLPKGPQKCFLIYVFIKKFTPNQHMHLVSILIYLTLK
jgi:hypothetical protein